MSLSEGKERSRRTTPGNEPVIRPGAILLTLVLMGVSALFIGITAAYLYSLFSTGAKSPFPPLIFLVNIPILMYATQALRKALSRLEEGLLPSMRTQLWHASISTLVFMVLQIIGWILFFRETAFLSSQLTGFLFILSATHLAHIVGGLPFLGSFVFRTRRDSLVVERHKNYWSGYLRGLCRYWRFLDILWILLVAVLWAGAGITHYV